MMRVFVIFFLFFSAVAQLDGQSVRVLESVEIPKVEKITKQSVPVLQKAYGDTLYYEDFSSGSINNLPQGWTESSSLSIQSWRWSTSAPGGQFTTVGSLNSTSASNGFMSLPLDSINTQISGTGGFVNINADITSSAIPIQSKSSLILTFETALRYCCGTNVDINLMVSTDSVNWDVYDASNSILANQTLPNATKVEIDVTQSLHNEDTAYFRFSVSGVSFYYWMIDDIVLYEGHRNGLKIEDYSINYNLMNEEVYTIVPMQIMNTLSFNVNTINTSAQEQSNVYLDYYVLHDSTWTGGSGLGTVYQNSTFISDTVFLGQRDTASTGSYLNLNDGFFTTQISIDSDSANFNAQSRVEFKFAVSDTVLAKDRNDFSSSTGVGDFLHPITQAPGGNQDDMMVTTISIGGTDSVLATSLSFYVANEPTNNGVQISPVIYEVTTPPSLAFSLVAENLNPFTIDSTMFGEWITIDFATGLGTGNIWLQGGQKYAIGWRQENGGNGEAFYTGRASSMESFQSNLENFVNFEGTVWGLVTSQLAVRLNFGNLVTKTPEIDYKNNLSFSVFPNPTNGEFTLTAESKTAKTYNLNVRNMLGQSVHAEIIAVNGMMTKNMNLNGLEKGVYFVSLENDEEKLVKKVVLK